MEYKKSFTNTAQAFTMAENVSFPGGCREGMRAAMTLTVGKPPIFSTCEKVMQLKYKHANCFVSPVAEFAGTELALMKQWASSPWETNIVHVPGIRPLNADPALVAQMMVVKVYPKAMSPPSKMGGGKGIWESD